MLGIGGVEGDFPIYLGTAGELGMNESFAAMAWVKQTVVGDGAIFCGNSARCLPKVLAYILWVQAMLQT